MWSRQTTFQWVGVWALITVLLGWLAKQTQESWIFYIVIATFVILVAGLLIQRYRKRQAGDIKVRYLIPQEKYPATIFNGAPPKEIWSRTLTIGIGTYKILHRLEPKVSICVDAPAFYFEGPSENKPKVFGIDNPYKVERIERIEGVYYRDWWGNVQQEVPNYPKYYHRGNVYAMGNRVQTFGDWRGKCVIEVPVRGVKVITFKMDFKVSTDPAQDNIPFLKVENDTSAE